MGVIAPDPGEVDAVHHREAPLSEKLFFTVDLVIFTVRAEQLQVLLVERAGPSRAGGWALPGGWLDLQRDDSIEACALRKLAEEAGVYAPYLEQLKTYGSRDRDPRGWTVTTVYFALMALERVRLGSDRETVCWTPVQGAGVGCALASDHVCILADAVERLRSKLEYTHIAVHLLPDEFTLPELQRTYEIVLQQPLDKSSFRRRVAQADMLEEIPGKFRDGSGRPAQLYRFRDYDRRTFFPRSIGRHAR